MRIDGENSPIIKECLTSERLMSDEGCVVLELIQNKQNLYKRDYIKTFPGVPEDASR